MYITAGLLFYVIFWMKKNLTSRDVIAQTNNRCGCRWQGDGVPPGVLCHSDGRVLKPPFFWWRPPVLTRAFPIPVFGGLLLAVLIGYLIVVQGRCIQLKKFFSYTSLLLVVFAAGMIAHGTRMNCMSTWSIKEHASEKVWSSVKREEGEEEAAVYSIFEPKTPILEVSGTNNRAVSTSHP